MKYTIYKITNMINNKIYIGCHKTLDLDDGYMGSGKHLKYAINKYGVENFEKEYLHIFDNSEEMFNMEATIVNEEFVKDKGTYNLKEGGSGGWDHISQSPLSHMKAMSKAGLEARKKRLEELMQDDDWREWAKEQRKIGIQEYLNSDKFKGGSMLGKKHTDETKKKIGLANSKNTGEKNSQFGTMWITNGTESKKIKKIDTIPEGFRKGRKQSL